MQETPWSKYTHEETLMLFLGGSYKANIKKTAATPAPTGWSPQLCNCKLLTFSALVETLNPLWKIDSQVPWNGKHTKCILCLVILFSVQARYCCNKVHIISNNISTHSIFQVSSKTNRYVVNIKHIMKMYESDNLNWRDLNNDSKILLTLLVE